jgi:hypothetical protein
MDNAKRDLYWVIIILTVLGLVWYLSGGLKKTSSTSGPFLKTPQKKEEVKISKQTADAARKVSNEIPTGGIISAATSSTSTQQPSLVVAPPSVNESFFKNEIKLSAGWQAKETDPAKEYVTITADSRNAKPIKITGWTIQGKTGVSAIIGQATYLPIQGKINPLLDVYLNPGEKAIILTGQSPLGYSFRLNKCIGYLSQFQTFVPSLPKNCPLPKNEYLPSTFNDACLDYIDKLQACQIQTKIDPFLQTICQDFVREKVNYSACVSSHKEGKDFYKPEWRIFINNTKEIWKQEREELVLRDDVGKIVDNAAY